MNRLSSVSAFYVAGWTNARVRLMRQRVTGLLKFETTLLSCRAGILHSTACLGYLAAGRGEEACFGSIEKIPHWSTLSIFYSN